MNVLHLHLTDDQGWRLEIQSHPELTRRGARFPTTGTSLPRTTGTTPRRRCASWSGTPRIGQVAIVPEIETPGHALAALAVYPGLSCTGGPFEIHPFFKGEHIHEDIFCAGNDDTFRFLEEVLDEVIALFPSEVIHVGGDEAPKGRWETCPKCQARIRAEGLGGRGGAAELVHRAPRALRGEPREADHRLGRDPPGGIPAGAAVMSWRGNRGRSPPPGPATTW